MSYRTIKRALGETNLERKCRVLFGLSLTTLMILSFWIYGSRTDQLVAEQNPAKGRLLVNTALVIKHWIFWSEQNDEFREVLRDLTPKIQTQKYTWDFLIPATRSGRDAPAMSSTAGEPSGAAPVVSSQKEGAVGAEKLRKGSGGAPSATAQAWSNSNLPAELIELLAQFPLLAPADQADELEAGRYIDNGRAYEYFQPVYAQTQTCVDCHRVTTGPSDLQPGELIAVARVQIPNSQTIRAKNTNRAILLSTAVLTGFLAMVASYAIVRYVIVKPLKHLRNVSDAVSRGDLAQRAEIHTADEFEELAHAFNRMLHHLLDAQQELRQVNANLDSKVDELAQLNMRLFELNRLKSDFLATMSHELRTPLNSIIGFSDVLGSIPSLDERQKRYVQNIQKSGKILLDMINDILDLAKIESGKMELRPSEFRLEHVVHAQCDMARPLTERKNLDLSIDVEPGLVVYQDQGKVQQILNNLLSNAIKFTPDGGRIGVAARALDGGRFELVVSDTGVGIAEADQTHIFEKFRQGRTVMPSGDALTREYSGTGLGLSIVKELCKLLGGDISLHSELGKGSVFTVRLPRQLPQPADGAMEDPLAEAARYRRPAYEQPMAPA